MTLKQYLIHLWTWIRAFPKLNDDAHMWIGVARTGDYECWICDAEKYDPDDDEPENAEFWEHISTLIEEHHGNDNPK